MRCYVEYRVPALVEVDLERDEIVSVAVDDEQVEGPVGVIAVEGEGISRTEESAAVRLAEEESWPAWDLGL